ncbi:MAG: hypothetical protein E6K19_01015 [Methanobacteriota archaeon]|nr:MAG: hypothetical protein E6K19_01015 [Euryarchaeota archaeon]
MRSVPSTFAIGYVIAVAAISLLSIGVSAFVPVDPLGLAQSLFIFIGIAYVFAAVLAWTGFANLYRYSPTLLAGSPSYRRFVVQGKIAEEGRDKEALEIGLLFGLSLAGTGLALSGGPFAILVIGVAFGILWCVRSLRRRTADSIRHP